MKTNLFIALFIDISVNKCYTYLHNSFMKGAVIMLLETKRLLIVSMTQPEFDPNARTVVVTNGIFIKSEGLTVERIMKNPSLTSRLGQPIGAISSGANGWIDYVVFEEYRNKGYATEALEVVKQFAIDNKVEPFLAIDDDNEASLAVAKKCGFGLVAKSGNQGRYYAGF